LRLSANCPGGVSRPLGRRLDGWRLLDAVCERADFEPASPRNKVCARAHVDMERLRRRRGLASPDDGDALAFTFAYPVSKRDLAEERRFDEALMRLKRWIV
jgi:hypothetical protein